ncbi:phytoene desaturase family protein [Gordonia insulae]|uniref:Zeta-carotene-forming phytoene desaturase n=1 Tax=Gordonia insulae TaxID=2420509 RepID=A0A3G8JGW9_9ACTN|nr:phytoene desaturase family protein [Gordonia insulae]AZG43689.1 zeta-carotene-forming phytoene desaturase [Gordonia insulae]
MSPTPIDSGARVVVIGAGLSGLSAALHLTGHGHRVTVVETADTPGGLVRTERLGDDGSHRFDTGATVLTMPTLIDDALAAVGVSADETRRRLALVDVDPSYSARFADGTALDVPRGVDRLADTVRDAFGRDAADGVRDLTAWLNRLYDVEFDTFIDRNLSSVRDLADRRIVAAAARLIAMGATRRLTPAVARHVDDERLQRIFTFQALYAGVPPQHAAAIYGVIAHMDVGLGVHYPAGGMGRIGEVMADALRDAGTRVMLSTAATSLCHNDGRATGVRLATGEVLSADAVVAAIPISAVADLLGTGLPRGPRWRRIRHSPSAVVIHGVAPRSVTQAWPGHHHTLDFGAAWSDTFRDLTRAPGRLMRDPSFLVTRPDLSDPDADATTERVSVLAPCPNLDTAGLPWDALAGAYAAECLPTLARRGYHRMDSALSILRIDHPGTWAAAGLPAGTPFGAAHTVRQTGPFRTPNRWPGSPNLVLAGAATVPGVGIPPVLVSGRLAAERVVESLGEISPRRRMLR